jgi:hypothetical protein
MLTFYNQDGRAVAYLHDNGKSIYLYSGEPVAWLSDESVYDYFGHYLGWFQDGWIRDRNGHCAFFTEDSSGGAARPARQARPVRGARQARPARGAREARPTQPARSTSWSDMSDESFFEQ